MFIQNILNIICNCHYKYSNFFVDVEVSFEFFSLADFEFISSYYVVFLYSVLCYNATLVIVRSF